MYFLKDICFLCLTNNIDVQSVLVEDIDGILVNEKLKSIFPEIIDSTPDEHKLACSKCIKKLRISYDFKQSVIHNNTIFKNYIDKLQFQHKSHLQLLVVLTRTERQIKRSFTRDFTATKDKNTDERHDRNSLKIHEKLNLTSTKQKQLNTHGQDCQLTTNENVALFTKVSCQTKQTNLETENVKEVDSLTEEIHKRQEIHVDDFASKKSKESKDSENNVQPKKKGANKTLHKCSDCPREFTKPSQLLIHRRKHTGEKLFPCQICQKKFSYASNVKLHILTHTGAKPHQCDVCGKSFSRKGNLATHQRSHYDIRPYECSVCDKSFIQKVQLDTHMRIHTGENPFACQICKFKCSDRTILVRHIRKHTGEKPYECSMCIKAFTHKWGLTTHMRLHSGETPFKCNFCRYESAQPSSLKRHIQTQHLADQII